MDWLTRRLSASLLIAGLGGALFVVASLHHASELVTIDRSLGPLTAFLLDSGPALLIVYAGYWLAESELPVGEHWTVWWRTLIGAVVIGGAFLATLLVRASEGRVVTEPIFPLLVAIETGALAGFFTSFYYARARVDARRAETVSDGLAFVNDLLRHDLRNDLNVISTRTELLRAQPERGEFDVEDTASLIVEKADEAIDRIETTETIVETLVDDPDFESVNLTSVTVELADRLDETHPIDVRTDLSETARVQANAGLQSVVDNLLENAVEHNDADDPYVAVEVSITDTAAWLTIRDNGSGIPPDRQQTLVEPGVQAGDGGLALVGTLVDMYGGTIWIEDNEPRGTVVTVELPLADDQN